MAITRTSVRPVERESTPSIVADRVREAIARGRIAPGAQLGEAELARELGVSRGPLREGLQRLAQEGLLISIRNRGVFVIEMSAANVRDMYLARSAVECAAAAEIIRGGGGPAAAARLLRVIARMDKAADRGSPLGDADIEFHDILVSAAGSPRLSRMHGTLLTETRMCIHALGRTYADDHERVTEHRVIAEAIGAEDAPLTDRLLREHMRDAIERLSGTGLLPDSGVDPGA